jgi:hypothetical protein
MLFEVLFIFFLLKLLMTISLLFLLQCLFAFLLFLYLFGWLCIISRQFFFHFFIQFLLEGLILYSFPFWNILHILRCDLDQASLLVTTFRRLLLVLFIIFCKGWQFQLFFFLLQVIEVKSISRPFSPLVLISLALFLISFLNQIELILAVTILHRQITNRN